MAALTLLRRLAEQHSYSALYEACQDAGGGDPERQVLLALAEVHLGNAAGARTRLAALEGTALNVDARVDLAAVHIALGEQEQAIAILETARREHPAHALLLARFAWCRLQQGQRDEAISLYEQSLGSRPLLAVYFNLLRLYRDQQRLPDMAACLASARTFWKDEQASWPDALRQIHGRQLRALQLDLWLEGGQLELAEDWVERQRQVLDPDDWCALLAAAAERLAARDRHAQAEEWLRNGLRHHPEQLALHDQLAELAHLQGRIPQAIALLRRAIRLAQAQAKPTDRLWTRLSATAVQWNPPLARHAAEQAAARLTECSESCTTDADGIAERRLQAELALAGVEAVEQRFEAAEQRYHRVLEHRPHMIAALQGLGQLQLQLGHIDEAAALFERMKFIDPARGHGALIQARRFPQDLATLEQLERFARTPALEGSVRSGVLFQLAAAWEEREDYARAFALADEANAACRRLLRYDPQAHRQRCARIRHAFPQALYQHRTDCGLPSTVPVFVVGMPRSGTTLVEQILAGHPRIHGAGELGTIPRVIAGLERWERHTGSGRRYPDCVDDLDRHVSRGIAENVLEELREYASEADHVVDKLPHNFENVGLIKLLFPRAKIISVRRDPRDIAVSNYFIDYAARHGGMGFAYDLEWIGEQLADHNLLMHHWHQVFPDELLEVHYEDLVDDPTGSARRMLDYIGVDWTPQVLEFAALERPVRTASVWQVRQPLYASSKARWQHYQQHLAPLIGGTNRRILSDPIDMVTLPEPGWLNAGVDRYRADDFDAAEYRFKQLLHHVPEHAAGRFMLGLVYVRKGHLGEGITLMEGAVERCPWNRLWRADLAQAYRLAGRSEEAAALADTRNRPVAAPPDTPSGEVAATNLDYLFLSEENSCPNASSASSRS